MTSNVSEINDSFDEQEQLALLRLRRLHDELAKAKDEAKAQSRKWGKPFLRACFWVFIVYLISLMISLLIPFDTPYSSILHRINNIGRLIFIVGTFYLVFRAANRKTAVLVSRADTALQDAVKEVGQQFPSMVERLGGAAALSDQGRVEDVLNLIGSRSKRGVSQTPVAQVTPSAEFEPPQIEKMNTYILVASTKPISREDAMILSQLAIEDLLKTKPEFVKMKNQFDQHKGETLFTHVEIPGDLNTGFVEMATAGLKKFMEWQPSCHKFYIEGNHFPVVATNASMGMRWIAIIHFE